jgi:membrane-associated phospholipid phosphatase
MAGSLPGAVQDAWVAAETGEGSWRFEAAKWAASLTLVVACSSIYAFTGKLQFARSAFLLTPLDEAIPLLPFTSFFYMPFFAGIFIMCTVFSKDAELYRRAVVAICVNAAVGAACHVLVAAEYPRPTLREPLDSLSLRFLALIYEVDPPNNVFPSMHVALSTTCAVFLYKSRRRIGLLSLLMSVVLAASTLTTKQHFIADVFGGYALSFASIRFALRGWCGCSSKSHARPPSPSLEFASRAA